MKKNNLIDSALLLTIVFLLASCNPHGNNGQVNVPVTSADVGGISNLLYSFTVVDNSILAGSPKAQLTSVKVTIPPTPTKTKTSIPFNFIFLNVGSFPRNAHIEMVTHTITGGDITTTYDDVITNNNVITTSLGNGNTLNERNLVILIHPDPDNPGKFRSTCNMVPDDTNLAPDNNDKIK